ncbi:MAG: DUF1772 domain-containing protein [Luteitalea sp.]|nr:DUF1772 domain-containing protein [Luteitalea sp.]
MWKDIVLWLFVVNLGIAFGAGLYEARVVIPQWANLPPTEWQNTGLLFWVYVTTVPLTLLTVLNAIAAYATRGPRRPWHLASIGVVIAERLATFSYFIPAMVRLMGAVELADADVRATLSRWLLMNHGRHALTLTAWLLALKALSLARKER